MPTERLMRGMKANLDHLYQTQIYGTFLQANRLIGPRQSGEHVSGFAIMALCCLLVETLQCYRDGLPSTMET